VRRSRPGLTGRRALAALAVALAALAVAIAVLLTAGGGRPPGHRGPPAPVIARVPPARSAPSGPFGARLLRRTQLRDRPAGHVVRAVGRLTGYGSKRVLAVVARRGGWLGVLSDHVPNSRVAWIPATAAELLHEPYRLDVDLSARLLTVRHEGLVVRRVPVAIGRPGTSTPTGRFAVTDSLRIGPRSPAYGCCALALTARQPHVPQGWSGGDRVAIHGTADEATIGTPASSGCMRADDADMRWLLRRITLGSQVRIRA
jgi:lipoprotein-anchoring transpeptidase ErfK/SrfK